MALDYRRVRNDDEYRAYALAAQYAFNDDRSEEATQRRLGWYDRDWCLGAFDGPQLIAGLIAIPFDMRINGGQTPLGGIASVASVPERRRTGAIGGLLRHALAEMRDAGQPLSGLYTPHYSLYRRFGWEQASRIMSYGFPPKTAKPRLPQPAGSYRRVTVDDWRELAPLYDEHWRERNGALVRPERWWQTQVMRTWRGEPHDAVIWSNAAGEPRGYAIYRSAQQRTGGPMPETVLRVHDWVALDAEAYAAILYYLLSHDLSSRIIVPASQDEPFAAAFEEPTHFVEPLSAWFGMMLRVVDLQRAVEMRPALPQASGKGVTIAIADDSAPWNEGTWRIEAGEGRMSAERTNTAPEIEMHARAFAPIFNGYMKPAEAVRVGQARANSAEAIAAATDMFSTSYAPFTPDDF